jgi:hypothetical protein
MPQGKILAVRPPLVNRPCAGTVEALEDNDILCLKKGNRYDFLKGTGNCCKEGNIVKIIGKNLDGTVSLECSKDIDEKDG